MALDRRDRRRRRGPKRRGSATDATEDRAALLSLLADPEHAVGVHVDAASAALLGLPEGEWESVGFWFAMRDTVYNVAVPTRNDSTEAGIPWEVYMVTAHTTTAGVFVAVDSRHGVLGRQPRAAFDNRIRGERDRLAGWSPSRVDGANPASDLASYDVYRGLDALFVPDASNLVASTDGTEYLDETWVKAYDYFYKLVAVDRHGNASPAALLAPGDVNVGTLLQSYAAALAGSCVEIAWTLSEVDADASF